MDFLPAESRITESHPILIAGIAGAVAGAISMGAGSYLSAKSEKEVTEKESDRKGIKRKSTHEEMKKKLVRFYRSSTEGISYRVPVPEQIE